MTSEDKFKELPIASSEEAVAKAIDRLSTVDKIKLMGYLHSPKNVYQVGAMYSVGSKEHGLNYGWLIEFADNLLALNCTIKGRRANAVSDVAKGHLEAQRSGVFSGVSDRVKSFIKRE